MRTSDLIALLQAEVEEHGDRCVDIYDGHERITNEHTTIEVEGPFNLTKTEGYKILSNIRICIGRNHEAFLEL